MSSLNNVFWCKLLIRIFNTCVRHKHLDQSVFDNDLQWFCWYERNGLFSVLSCTLSIENVSSFCSSRTPETSTCWLGPPNQPKDVFRTTNCWIEMWSSSAVFRFLKLLAFCHNCRSRLGSKVVHIYPRSLYAKNRSLQSLFTADVLYPCIFEFYYYKLEQKTIACNRLYTTCTNRQSLFSNHDCVFFFVELWNKVFKPKYIRFYFSL